MSESEAVAEAAPDTSNADAVAAAVATDRPEWLQSKYETEGRSMEEAISEQAKGYNEIRSRMGAFTGAPDAYEANISPELTEAGYTPLDEDPRIDQFNEIAKELNLSQDGYDKMLNMYASWDMAETEAAKAAEPERVKEELAKLGTNADQRVKNVQDWIGANMTAEEKAGLEAVATSAEAVMAIESLIAKTRNAPQATAEVAAAPTGISKEDALKMRYVKHENGQLMMSVDPEYRRKADAALEAAVG